MSSGAFTYRVLSSDEWRLARSLRMTALLDSPGAFLGTMTEAQQMDRDDWLSTFESGEWFVVEASGRPVGITRARVVPGATDELYLESVWVDRSHRRSGALRGLLQAIGREAARRRATALRLAVLHSNAPAQRIFVSLGFARSGTPNASEQQLVADVATLIS